MVIGLGPFRGCCCNHRLRWGRRCRRLANERRRRGESPPCNAEPRVTPISDDASSKYRRQGEGPVPGIRKAHVSPPHRRGSHKASSQIKAELKLSRNWGRNLAGFADRASPLSTPGGASRHSRRLNEDRHSLGWHPHRGFGRSRNDRDRPASVLW
jgi:hypothetical protein